MLLSPSSPPSILPSQVLRPADPLDVSVEVLLQLLLLLELHEARAALHALLLLRELAEEKKRVNGLIIECIPYNLCIIICYTPNAVQ